MLGRHGVATVVPERSIEGPRPAAPFAAGLGLFQLFKCRILAPASSLFIYSVMLGRPDEAEFARAIARFVELSSSDLRLEWRRQHRTWTQNGGQFALFWPRGPTRHPGAALCGERLKIVGACSVIGDLLRPRPPGYPRHGGPAARQLLRREFHLLPDTEHVANDLRLLPRR
jgi:hypothetical protein